VYCVQQHTSVAVGCVLCSAAHIGSSNGGVLISDTDIALNVSAGTYREARLALYFVLLLV
jgi:hypothetical protein